MARTYKRATNHVLRDSGEIKQKGTSDGDDHQRYAKVQLQNILLRTVCSEGVWLHSAILLKDKARFFSVTAREAHRTNFLLSIYFITICFRQHN